MSFPLDFGVGSIWGPIIASLAMVCGIIIAWLIVSGSRRTAPQNPTDEKLTTYACGEDLKFERKTPSDIQVEETRPHGERFFSPISEVFRGFYKYIRGAHSGDLSTYIIWMVAGILIFILSIWIVLGW